MGSQNIHLLLIEDNPGDAGLICEMLAESKGMSFELEWTETLSEGIERLALGGIDVVLLDLALTDSTGLETLRTLRTASPRAPVVVVLSGLSDEEISFQAVQEGAQDYLIKGQVDTSLLVRSSGVRNRKPCGGRTLNWKTACESEPPNLLRPMRHCATASTCYKASWITR